MRVVITGAKSFIGRVLIAECEARGLETVQIDVANPSGNCYQADIRSPGVQDLIPFDADALIHLAAISRDADCRADPKLAFDVNVNGTLNLIDAARRRGVKQFVFASSEWVYGPAANHEVQTEDQPIDITRLESEYALTKIVGEQCLTLAHARGFCPVTILRFGIVYGPRPANWSAVEQLFHAVRTQDTVEVASLRTARRFIHVSDIARGICCSLGTAGCQVFNLSADQLVSLEEIIAQSSLVLGRRPRVIESNRAATSIRNPSNQKARALLGWIPSVSLKEGLLTLQETA